MSGFRFGHWAAELTRLGARVRFGPSWLGVEGGGCRPLGAGDGGRRGGPIRAERGEADLVVADPMGSEESGDRDRRADRLREFRATRVVVIWVAGGCCGGCVATGLAGGGLGRAGGGDPRWEPSVVGTLRGEAGGGPGWGRSGDVAEAAEAVADHLVVVEVGGWGSGEAGDEGAALHGGGDVAAGQFEEGWGDVEESSAVDFAG